jgi:DNA-binding beta-propeller fold protein YncE
LGEVKTGENPDAILYDPAAKTVFTFNGHSKDATVFQAATGKVVATIPLGGKPEFAATNGSGRVYVNIEDTNEVVEIDSLANRIYRRIALKPCNEPTGMGIDVKRGRIFSGCHNKIMTVVDTNSGTLITTLPIGDKVDGNGFDAETGLAFSSNGDGTLTVAKETYPGIFKVLETVPTQTGSRTMAVDPVTHNVYLPAAKFLLPQKPGSRPEMVKGSFELLVVGN